MNQLKAGAMLSYVVLGLNTIVGLVYTPYMIHSLGQSEYGLYSLVSSIIAYLTILDLGFGSTIVRYTSKFRAEGKKEEQYAMFGMFTSLYLIIGLIAFCIGMVLYFNVDVLFDAKMRPDELNTAQTMMLLLSINLAITFPFSIFGSIITAYEDFIFQRIVQIIRIVLNIITMIVLLHIGYKAISLVLSTTIFNILSLFLNYWYCIKRIKIKIIFRRFNWPFFKEITNYSVYIVFNTIMDRIYWSTGQIILGVVSGTAAVAVYSVAITLQQMYMTFSTAISGVFLPKVTSMVATFKSDKEFSNLFIRIGRVQYIMMSYILVAFLLFGKQFVTLWAGKNYNDAYAITLLFFIPLTIPLIQNMGITILKARNQLKFRSLVYLCIAIISCIFSFVLAKKYGAIGCAWGTSIALILGQIIIMNIYYHKKQAIDIILFWKEILKMSIVPIIFCTGGWFILKCLPVIESPLDFVIYATIFSLLYFIIFFSTSVNKYEKDLFLSPIKKILRINRGHC